MHCSGGVPHNHLERVVNKNAAEKIREDATIDSQGVVRWKSNNRIPFSDMLEDALAQGVSEINLALSNQLREEEQSASLAAYRATPRTYSDETLSEMRAAFGAGETVVDVLSGQQIKL